MLSLELEKGSSDLTTYLLYKEPLQPLLILTQDYPCISPELLGYKVWPHTPYPGLPGVLGGEGGTTRGGGHFHL